MTRNHRIVPSAVFLCLPFLFQLTGAVAQPAGTTALEEILVTARKREESLQDTPIAVTAITAATIEQAKLFNVRDIENVTPNLNFVVTADGSSSTLGAFIRGVGQFDFAVTTDPGVGVYTDGVYLARAVGANLEFSDVERVEVLRGPQGTLFGKNTIGGAINVVTRRPDGRLAYDAKVTGGEYGYARFDGYLQFPIAEGLSGSIAGLWKQSDGWQDRDRGDDAGNDDMWGLRGHLNWDVSDGWNSHLVVDGVDQDQNVYPRVLSDFDPTQVFPFFYNTFVLPPDEFCCETNIDDIDESGVLNRLDRDQLKTLGVSWTNTWTIGDLELRSITGYRNMDAEMYRDSDNQQQDYFSVETGFDTDQYSQEFLLSNAGGSRFDWLVGAYFFREDADHLTNVTVADGLYEALAALPPFITDPNGIPLQFFAVPLDLTLQYKRNQETTSYAAFFSTTWHWTERLRLNVAARYTYEEKDLDVFTLKRASQTPIALPGPTDASQCGNVVPAGAGSRFGCDEDWDEFSPKVGMDYDFSDNVMGYALISRGFRSGVFNGRPIATEEISVADPETVTSYEVGLKTTLLDQHLRLNGALFYNDYEDQQFLVNRSSADTAVALVLLVENAAESTMAGAELEFSALLGKGFTVSGGLSWLDAEYDKFEQVDFVTGEVQDLSDRKWRDAPEWTANLMVQWEHRFGNGGIDLRRNY